jgi:hypothetical protein
MNVVEVAKNLEDTCENIVLVYGFNSTGKTRLSVAYKDATKDEEGNHSGVYYNAFSEDMFVWDNDIENGEADLRLNVLQTSLSRLHASLNEDSIREKLRPYKPTYEFSFTLHDDVEKDIDSITFFIPDPKAEHQPPPIKISRGEERIFVWCFFLALFEVEGWVDEQSSHFFIDDPVSSLDDHNIFVTAFTIYDLIESQFQNRKIIVTTHHIGLFSILHNYLLKGEKSGKFKDRVRAVILSGKRGELSRETRSQDVFLYHLRMLQLLNKAKDAGEVKAYHLVLLRQVLENVASFLGTGRVSYVLDQIGVEDVEDKARILNTLSHKNIYFYETDELVNDSLDLFEEIFSKLMIKYNFVLHVESK